MTREERLAKGPIFKTMLAMGIPTFIAQLINLLYNIVDRIYIGHIPGCGVTALTGVGICFPIITFISAFSNLVGAGGAPLAGIALGKGDRETAEHILGNGVTILLGLAVVLTLLFQVIKKPFLYMFGASDATYVYSEQYLSIYLCGTIFVMLSLGLNLYITIQGAATTAMLSIVIGAVLNLILDPIFIFVLGLGVRGAACATIISQAACAFWILRFLTSKGAGLKIKKKNMRLKKAVVGQVLSLGISPFIMSATESLITVVFNRGAQIYGNDLYVGSITIMQSVIQMVFVPINGFAQGVQSIVSYNYGAGNIQRVKKTTLTLIGICFSVALLLSLTAVTMPKMIAGIFTEDQALLELCGQVLPVFISGMLVFGLQSGSQNSFMALGKAKQSLFFALFRKVILLVPLALILPVAMNSVMGLYYAEPISDALSAICCVTVFMITLRKIEKEKR